MFVVGQGLANTYTDFSFTGTGFDIISSTGTDQGVIRVDIYTDAARTNLYKKVSVLNKSESDLSLFQIPVVSVNGLDYGTYYVRIGVGEAYTSETYPQLNRGGEFYFDAIRVYDPINVKTGQTDATMALSAYIADGEASESISEVRALLLDAGENGTFDEVLDPSGTDGVVFVDRVDTGDGTHIAKVATYETIGPNNEVYLVGDQSLGFYIDFGSEIPTSVHIGAKSADGKPATLIVGASYEDGTVLPVVQKEITSNTSMYYDVLGGTELSSNQRIYVIVANGGSGVLSITDIKVAYGVSLTGAATIGVDDTAVDNTVKYVSKRIGVQQEAANYDIVSAEFTETSIRRKTVATLIVTTPEAVESLEILNSSGRADDFEAEYEIVDGVKVWTVKMTITAIGNRTYTITGYSADGLAGASAEASIKVTIF